MTDTQGDMITFLHSQQRSGQRPVDAYASAAAPCDHHRETLNRQTKRIAGQRRKSKIALGGA